MNANVDVKTLSTHDLVAEYNLLTGKSIKKFSSRAQGELQVLKARRDHGAASETNEVENVMTEQTDEVTEQTEQEVTEATTEPTDEVTEQTEQEVTEATTEPTDEEPTDEEPTDEEKAKLAEEAKAKHEARSQAVANSWNDPNVRILRTARVSCKVTLPNGEVKEYASVGKAFDELGLPGHKFPAFRGALRDEGTKVFKHGDAEYIFEGSVAISSPEELEARRAAKAAGKQSGEKKAKLSSEEKEAAKAKAKEEKAAAKAAAKEEKRQAAIAKAKAISEARAAAVEKAKALAAEQTKAA